MKSFKFGLALAMIMSIHSATSHASLADISVSTAPVGSNITNLVIKADSKKELRVLELTVNGSAVIDMLAVNALEATWLLNYLTLSTGGSVAISYAANAPSPVDVKTINVSINGQTPITMDDLADQIRHAMEDHEGYFTPDAEGMAGRLFGSPKRKKDNSLVDYPAGYPTNLVHGQLPKGN